MPCGWCTRLPNFGSWTACLLLLSLGLAKALPAAQSRPLVDPLALRSLEILPKVTRHPWLLVQLSTLSLTCLLVGGALNSGFLLKTLFLLQYGLYLFCGGAGLVFWSSS